MNSYFSKNIPLQGVTQKFWEDDVLNKFGKTMHAGHHLSNRRHELLTQQGSIRHFLGPGDAVPLVGTRGKSLEAPTTWRHLRSKTS